MLRHDFMNKGFDRAATDQLRYFLYLARDNAWVKAGDELMRFEIKDRVESTQTKKGDTIYYGNESHPMSAPVARYLQVLLSKNVSSASVFSVSKSSAGIEASEHAYLPDVKFDAVYADYPRLYFCVDISRGICVHAKAENFDFSYLNKVNAVSDKEAKEKLLLAYNEAKEAAQLDATKNAIWLAAKSGDSQQLDLLLSEFREVDLNSKYKGKSLLDAMLSANPKDDLPFKNDKPDYQAVVDILSQHGLHRDSLAECCKRQNEQKSVLSFFQRRNPLKEEMLALFTYKSGLESTHQDDADLRDACTIM